MNTLKNHLITILVIAVICGTVWMINMYPAVGAIVIIALTFSIFYSLVYGCVRLRDK